MRYGEAMKKTRGRPEKADNERRDEIIQIRVTSAEKAQIQAGAEKARRSVGDWMRVLALDASGEA